MSLVVDASSKTKLSYFAKNQILSSKQSLKLSQTSSKIKNSPRSSSFRFLQLEQTKRSKYSRSFLHQVTEASYQKIDISIKLASKAKNLLTGANRLENEFKQIKI